MKFLLDTNTVIYFMDGSLTQEIKVADAIIAACAILHNLTLISRNEKDFKHISGLNFINPFDL